MPRRPTYQTARQYPRTARLNELVREIVADELERIGDERLELLAVTAVAVEPDMRHATVLYDSLHGADDDDTVQEALREHRVRLQRAIGRQARIKRTPELVFRPDEAVRSAARLDEILRHLSNRAEHGDGGDGGLPGQA